MSTEIIAENLTIGAIGFFIAICVAAIVAKPSPLPTGKKWLLLAAGALVVAALGVATNYILGVPFFGGLLLGYLLRKAPAPV